MQKSISTILKNATFFFEQSSYRLCYIVKDEMVLLKSFYKKPLLKPLVSKITYIAFSNNKNSKKN